MEATASNQDPSNPSYQQLDVEENDSIGDNSSVNHTPDHVSAAKTTRNFTLMSILFSANHGCVVSCLALASARLGSTGSWQSGILYISYTASALLGATYITKKVGSRKAIFYGMALYCIYVGCFLLATITTAKRLAAWSGAAVGGIGAGFLWTAQGSYFGSAAEEHARQLDQPVETSTAHLAGIFAFWYLAEEVVLRLLSSFLLETGIASWEGIFFAYFSVAVLSLLPMPYIREYPQPISDNGDAEETIFQKVTVTGRLLVNDSKMKYMIGLNATFGFTAAFLSSYVNGEILPVALNDPDSKYIGVFTSWASAVAAAMSLLFGKISPHCGKGPILIGGAICFFFVVFPFLLQPDGTKYNWQMLLLIYSFQGTGRATFESTLKATFADFFPYEKEGAFANIILQSGLSGAIGFILTFALLCQTPGKYCVEYSNGTLHDVLSFELIVVISAFLAIAGYLRAAAIHQSEQRMETSSLVS